MNPCNIAGIFIWFVVVLLLTLGVYWIFERISEARELEIDGELEGFFKTVEEDEEGHF